MSDEPQAGEESGGEIGASPGALLKTTREERGIAPEEAAEALGVGTKVVVALEADDYAELGAPVYVRGYLRKYGRYLGVSGDQLVAGYEARAAPHDPDVLAHATTTLPRSRNARWLVPASAGIFVIVLVLVGLWAWRRVRQNASPTHRVPAAAVSAAMALTGSAPAHKSAAVRSQAARTSPAASAATVPAAVKTLHLMLEIQKPSWVEVYSSSGKRLYYNLASAGQALDFDSKNGSLTVFLGNADGVKVLVDGRAFSIPTGARSGNTARFQVTGASAPEATTSRGT